jgi:hypothetical protein
MYRIQALQGIRVVPIARERLLLGRRINRRPRHKREDNIKSECAETGWDDVAEFI